MVGGRDYGASQFNRATDAMRQPGSSFKPYVYATALEHGMKPTSIVVDAPICIGNWCPHNYGGGYRRLDDADHGAHPLDQHRRRCGSRSSSATATPSSAAPRIIETARDMGITTPLPDTPSLPIGADAVTCSSTPAPTRPSPTSARR